MAVRSKSNYKSTKDAIITTNGVGDISGADVNSTFEDSADSFVFNNGTSTINSATWDGSYTSTSGVDTNLTIQPTVNQASGTGGSTALKINVITTTLGSGVHNILQLQDTGTDKFLIDVDGTVTVTNKIVSVSDGDIDIEPNGTGNVLLGNFTFNADQTVGAGQDNFVLTYDDGTGLISLEVAAGGGGGAFTADGDTQITPTTPIVLDQSTGDEIGLDLSLTVNKATSGNYTAIKCDVTETAAPGSSDLLLDLQVGGVDKFKVDNTGAITSASDINFQTSGNIQSGAINAIEIDASQNVTISNGELQITNGVFKLGSDILLSRGGANLAEFGFGDILRFGQSTQRTTIRGNVFDAPVIGVSEAFQAGLGFNQGTPTTNIGVDLHYYDGATKIGLAIDPDNGNVTIANGQLKTTASTTLAAINVGSFAGDPSALVNGDKWYNSSTEKFRARENGASVDEIGPGFDNNAANNQLAKSDGTDLIDSGITVPSSGDIDLSGSFGILSNSTTDGSIDIRPDGSGDIQLTRTNDASSRLIMQNASSGISFEFNATGLGFFGTTPIAQPSAYTRNATIVEDKTLLASASATTINNNNVLAALINDLQLLGLVA